MMSIWGLSLRLMERAGQFLLQSSMVFMCNGFRFCYLFGCLYVFSNFRRPSYGCQMIHVFLAFFIRNLDQAIVLKVS